MDIAAATGELCCRNGAVVSDVLIDASGRTTGVRWYDRATKATLTARSPIVFLCASSLETTRILLSSGSDACPDGIGAKSGALGRYLIDHAIVSGEGIGGNLPGEPVPAEPGRCVYLPRFDLREARGASKENTRGYGVQVYRWSRTQGSSFTAVSFGEMLPRAENRVSLDPHLKNAFGMPALRIACRHSPDELRLAAEQSAAIRELGDMLGVRFLRLDTKPSAPGTAMHEAGTARMGDSPSTSVLDPHNECWDVRGLYVTDASAFPSQGAQNPTLTILALTTRACNRVVHSR
jgi:choline dehydrogenase-like flavoprotein